MRKVTINGKEITTNYGENGADTVVAGNDLPNYGMAIKNSCMESDYEFAERLSRYYSRIRLAKVTTMVLGIYDTIAYCR